MDPFAERGDEFVENGCAQGVFPQGGVEEVFAFDVLVWEGEIVRSGRVGRSGASRRCQ